MSQDPFSVLGISSSATEDEIKAAYRRLAKQYHPDLNPGDRNAEEKMKEVNEAYTRALQYRRNGGAYQSNSGYGGAGPGSGYGSFGGSGPRGYRGYGAYDQSDEYRRPDWDTPFGGFGFNPFETMFGHEDRYQGFRTRNYTNPELKTVETHVLAHRYDDALQILNRIPNHDADWHALCARVHAGLGNRVSAMEHARTAAAMAPSDPDYQNLFREIRTGAAKYRQVRSEGGYNYQTAVCSNPFLRCCALNLALNCCLGGRFGFCC